MLIFRSFFSSLSFLAALCSISMSTFILSYSTSALSPLPFLTFLTSSTQHNTTDLLTVTSHHYTSLQGIMSKNKVYKSFIGLGYYETLTPGVIQRNVSQLNHLHHLLVQFYHPYSYFHASFHFHFCSYIYPSTNSYCYLFLHLEVYHHSYPTYLSCYCFYFYFVWSLSILLFQILSPLLQPI